MSFSIIKSIINKFYLKKVIIKNEFVHFLPNDKFSLPFISFMNKYFINYDQCFVYLLPDKNSIFNIPKNYKNVFVVNNLRQLNLDLNSIKKIYMHSLGNKKVTSYLYKNKEMLKLCYWLIWGHDLYYNFKVKYLKDKFYGYTKKDRYVKSNIGAVIATFDKEKYEEKYTKNKKIIELPYYPNVIKKSLLDSIEVKKTDCKVIQINNSSDKSTIEMLEILKKFNNENIKIVTILSYGQTIYNDEKYLRKVKIYLEINFVQ